MEIVIVFALVIVIAQLIGMALGKRLKNEAYSIVAPPVIVGLLILFFSWWLLLEAREFGRALTLVFSLIAFFIGCTISLLIAATISALKSGSRSKR